MASLGAVSVIVLGVALLLPLAAFAGAFLAMAAALGLAGSLGTLTPGRTVVVTAELPHAARRASLAASTG